MPVLKPIYCFIYYTRFSHILSSPFSPCWGILGSSVSVRPLGLYSCCSLNPLAPLCLSGDTGTKPVCNTQGVGTSEFHRAAKRVELSSFICLPGWCITLAAVVCCQWRCHDFSYANYQSDSAKYAGNFFLLLELSTSSFFVCLGLRYWVPSYQRSICLPKRA